MARPFLPGDDGCLRGLDPGGGGDRAVLDLDGDDEALRRRPDRPVSRRGHSGAGADVSPRHRDVAAGRSPLPHPHGPARRRAATAGGWLRRSGVARWGKASAPAGLVAAISPDYGSYKPSRAHTSGLLVRNGVLLHVPVGVVRPPSVGYTTDDRMVFGTPRAVPLRIRAVRSRGDGGSGGGNERRRRHGWALPPPRGRP